MVAMGQECIFDKAPRGCEGLRGCRAQGWIKSAALSGFRFDCVNDDRIERHMLTQRFNCVHEGAVCNR